MNIYPAIDIRNGRCVRLIQGDYSKETVFSSKPMEVAKEWESKGADWIHIVDLDGAKTGAPENSDIIRQIRKATKAKLQVGGGIRDLDIVEAYLNDGINRIIFGSAAVEDISLIKKSIDIFGTEKIAVGIDVKNGYVATHGWIKTSKTSVDELLEQLYCIGVKTIIYTDISKDGMMSGPNFVGLEKILKKGRFSVIASGGISSLDDIKKLKSYEDKGLDGAIIGKALYSKTIFFEDIQNIL